MHLTQQDIAALKTLASSLQRKPKVVSKRRTKEEVVKQYEESTTIKLLTNK